MPNQLYKGQSIYLEFIDGSTMQRVSASRVIDGCEVFRTAYFNGRGDGSRCYIARRSDYTAHGDSVAAAVRDVQFKELQENFDSDQLVEKIKSCGIVTFIEYRLLTGACESGLRAGIKSAGLPEDTQELPLNRVLELCRGHYGGNRMIELFS